MRAGAWAAGRSVQRTVPELTRRTLIAGRRAVRERDASPERGARERGPRGPAPATAPPRVCGQPPLPALAALSKGVAHSRARRRLGRRPISSKNCFGVDATNADRGAKSRCEKRDAPPERGARERGPRGPAPATAPPRVCGQPPHLALAALSKGVAHSRARRRLCRRPISSKNCFGVDATNAARGAKSGARTRRVARKRRSRAGAARTGAGDGSASRPWTTPAPGARGAVNATNAARGAKSGARTRRVARKRRSRAGAARIGAGDGSASRPWTPPRSWRSRRCRRDGR